MAIISYECESVRAQTHSKNTNVITNLNAILNIVTWFTVKTYCSLNVFRESNRTRTYLSHVHHKGSIIMRSSDCGGQGIYEKLSPFSENQSWMMWTGWTGTLSSLKKPSPLGDKFCTMGIDQKNSYIIRGSTVPLQDYHGAHKKPRYDCTNHHRNPNLFHSWQQELCMIG